jgi:hypothetical protein
MERLVKTLLLKNQSFNFEAPKFKPKLDLPKASENPDAKKYLENRKLNPDKFYYTDKFKSWTNSLKDVFDDTSKDEPRIIIPLFYQNTLVGFQGRALGPNKIKYITVMLNDDAPKIYGLDEIEKTKLSTSQKVHSTQLSFTTRLLFAELTVMLVSGVLAIVFGSMITNHVMQKSIKNFPCYRKMVKKLSSGLQR